MVSGEGGTMWCACMFDSKTDLYLCMGMVAFHEEMGFLKEAIAVI